jgi:hypothetical protein
MSGPKVVTYTMNAFEGKLKDFMRMQAKLTQMSFEMQEAEIHDETFNIHFDCKDSYKKIAADFEKALKNMVFDYKGTFNQKTHDIILKKINERTQQLSEVVKKSEAILSDYHSKQKDYNSFLDYNLFVKNAQSSFDKFKTDVGDNLQTNFAKKNAVVVEEAKKKYGSILYEQESKSFSWGFDKMVEEEKNVVVNHVIEKENLVRDIRQELLDKVIATDTNQKITTPRLKKTIKPNDDIIKISKKIELMVNSCNEKAVSSNYSDQFNKLKHSESMNDLFFYQEMHDRILENETSRKNKLAVNNIIAVLNSTTYDKALSQDKKYLLQRAVKLIDSNKLSEKEVHELKKEHELLVKRNLQLAEDLKIKKKEQLFVKSQIIMNLENMGYEVMDDLNVIDFEKEDEQNLLNIKFKEDGSFRYVFQIPEKKEELSVEEQKMRLHEMKTTCGDFSAILNDLKQMGVDINVKSDKPIELSSMITIPETVSSKLKTKKTQTQRKQQLKKLYLD